MSGLFPEQPFIPVAQDTVPVCEWIVPERALQQRDYFRTCTALPSGMPDYLLVSVAQDEDGVERCTAAIYRGRAYVIHYEYKPAPTMS